MSEHIQVQEDMRNGRIALEKYVITKSLTRAPEAYPDARNQPHVEVSPKDLKYIHNQTKKIISKILYIWSFII